MSVEGKKLNQIADVHAVAAAALLLAWADSRRRVRRRPDSWREGGGREREGERERGREGGRAGEREEGRAGERGGRAGRVTAPKVFPA